jgi:hypothetical protein
MIGRFKSARDAEKAKELIEQLINQVSAEPDVYRHDAAPQGRRFSDAMLNLLKAAELYSLGPTELEQFSYDTTVKVKGSEVIVKTDEVDVSAFLKVLLDKGARIEVYSAHEYPDTGY